MKNNDFIYNINDKRVCKRNSFMHLQNQFGFIKWTKMREVKFCINVIKCSSDIQNSNMAWYVNKKPPYKKLRMILVNLGQNNAHDFEDLGKNSYIADYILSTYFSVWLSFCIAF